MADEWENFIRDLPAGALAEALPAPAYDERPGSRADMEMRMAHDYVRRDYWARHRTQHPQLEDVERRQRHGAEHEAWVAAVVAARMNGQIQTEVAAYAARRLAQRTAAAAAHTRGHAA